MSPRPEGEPITVVFLLVDGLSMMSLASALEPLRSANHLLGREAYRWRLASLDGGPVTASNGLPFETAPVADCIEGARYLFVCGGLRLRPVNERGHYAALRRAARLGLGVGSLSTGAFLLARAGLLGGHRVTVHWESRPAFEEEFPDLECTGKIYEIDRDRLTCSGGTAAMDLMLHLVVARHGPDLAEGIANQFHHARIRDEHDDQRGGRLRDLASAPRAVRLAVEAMGRHLEEPLSVAEVAARAGLSPRQVERLFLRHLGMSPARYALALRIDRARELLLHTDRPVLEIAVATGFASTSHFSQWFRRFHGLRPSEVRARAAPVRT